MRKIIDISNALVPGARLSSLCSDVEFTAFIDWKDWTASLILQVIQLELGASKVS